MILARRSCRGCGRVIVVCRDIEACEKCGTIYAGVRQVVVTARMALIVRVLALRLVVTGSELIFAVYYELLGRADEPDSASVTIQVHISRMRAKLRAAGIIINRKTWRGYELTRV